MSGQAAGNKTYGYDSFDRLTSFFNATNTTSYTYDANSAPAPPSSVPPSPTPTPANHGVTRFPG